MEEDRVMDDQESVGLSPQSGTTTGRTFDPRPHLRTITSDGRQTEYLDVKWRLAWLRTEHPEAQIETEHVLLNEDSAVFRAMVYIPGAGCATGYGSETREDWADFIETAETKAIGRALAALGYGTQFAMDFDADVDPKRQRLADSPAEAPRRHSTGSRSRSTEQEQADGPVASSARANRAEWDEFWRWARSLGYQNKTQLEEMFGHSLEGMSPAQVREELEDYHSQQEGDSP